MNLDPELARIVARMPRRPETTDVPHDQYGAVRDAAHAYFGLHRVPPRSDIVEFDETVPASRQPVRIYRPVDLGGPLPALVWIHGGGFSLGMIDADDARCRRYASEAQCAVVSVEYRLAPENPYPAGVDDCWAALQWVATNALRLDIDGDRLAIGGASAGGCLAAVVAQRAKTHKAPSLVFQMLVYPCLDDRMTTKSSLEKIDVPVINRRETQASWRRYLHTHVGEVSADAAPARQVDLAGLPPTFLMTAEHDPFRDEGNEYAMRLLAADVPTELHHFAGAFHGFESIGLDAEVARRALSEQSRALRAALHDPLVSL